MEVPRSVSVAVAANKPEVETVAPEDCVRKQRIKVQLLFTYNFMAVVAFGSLIGICGLGIFPSSEKVIDDSRSALKTQVLENAKSMLREAGSVLDARLEDGFSVLVQPATFALFDVLGGSARSNIGALQSFTEPSKGYLSPPLTYEDRYRCVSSANDAVNGCNSLTQKQELSLTASSVYAVGSTTTGDGWDATGMIDDGAVNDTTILDPYVKPVYAIRPAWVDSFVSGMAGDPPTAPVILRQYPGAVGNLNKDSSDQRTYDPSKESWYTSVTAQYGNLGTRATDAYLEQWPMIISAPYLSDLGRGYLLSVMAPIAGPDGATKGVSGADILVSSLQALVTTIKSRETGEALFLYRSTGDVVASKQLSFVPEPTSIPKIDTLTLPGQTTTTYTFADLTDCGICNFVDISDFESDAQGTGSMRKTDPSGKAYWIVWQDVWQDSYTLLTCTPESEILDPIESQLTTIRSSAGRLFGGMLTVCLTTWAFVVILVFILAQSISRPTRKTLEQSTQIIRNIGGNLFNNVKVTGRRPDEKATYRDSTNPVVGLIQTPGEIAALRGEFLKALFTLGKKREREVPPRSPIFHSGLPPNAPSASIAELPANYLQCVKQILPEKTDTQKARDAAVMTAPVPRPLTFGNSITTKLFVWLLMPVFLAMVLVTTITFSTVEANVEKWLTPVRTGMREEELSSLNVRAYERAQLASAFIGTAAGSLKVLQGVATELVDGTLPHGDAKTTYYYDYSAIKATSYPAITANSYFDSTALSVSRGPRPKTTDNNYKAPVTYRPPTALPSSVTALKSGEPTPASISPLAATTPQALGSLTAWEKEQMLMSQLDQALAAVFYSTNITYAYIGLHASETYRQFPYQKLDSFVQGERTCDAFPNQAISAFTVLCRSYYQEALAQVKGTDVTYNRVLNDAVNVGATFLPLSAAVRRTSDGALVGVAVVDVSLAELANLAGGWPDCYADGSCWSSSFGDSPPAQITGSNLYKRGYAMLWDAQGYAIVHKSYAKDENSNRGALKVADLDSAGDLNFKAQFEQQMLNKGRVSGNWSYAWWNSEKGKPEVWHYSFLPVPGTPYMIALTVVEDEVTEVPDKAEASIRESLIGAQVASWCIAMLLIIPALAMINLALDRRFARPFKKLIQTVRSWGKRDFSQKIDHHDVENALSFELTELMSNFKKMLVALRFGETKWANGNMTSVMENNFAALALVQETGNDRGLGVVLNNIALASADTRVSDRYPQLETGEIYNAAVKIAKEQVAREPSNPALGDTLAYRLLNYTLWHLRADPPRPAEAAALLFELMQSCTNARTMTTIAQMISLDLASGASGPDRSVLSAVTALIFAALDALVVSPIEFDHSDIIADLVSAHCDIGCIAEDGHTVICSPPQLAMWALLNVPVIGETTRTRLSLHVKTDADAMFVAFIDRACQLDQVKGATGPVKKGEAVQRFKESTGGGPGLPKLMMFVLDLSYSMDSDHRLPTCKKALVKILKENLQDFDAAGLITFADDVKTDISLRKAGPYPGKVRGDMLTTVNALRTRGMTAFYDACCEGARALQLVQGRIDCPVPGLGAKNPRWLVALTDGADNMSSEKSIAECIKTIKNTPNLNVALITVGNEIDLRVCQQFLDAAIDAGNIGLMIQANNVEEISNAFAVVAQAMAGGIVEVL